MAGWGGETCLDFCYSYRAASSQKSSTDNPTNANCNIYSWSKTETIKGLKMHINCTVKRT